MVVFAQRWSQCNIFLRTKKPNDARQTSTIYFIGINKKNQSYRYTSQISIFSLRLYFETESTVVFFLYKEDLSLFFFSLNKNTKDAQGQMKILGNELLPDINTLVYEG